MYLTRPTAPRHGKTAYRPAALALAAAVLAGCATTPAERLSLDPDSLGLVSETIEGSGFRHQVLANPAAVSGGVTRLHVYLDGDGTPWIGPGRPAADPTPRAPLVPRLMALDPAPAVYLGRPCYGSAWQDDRCNVWHWTHGRYGEAVVDSLAAALAAVRRQTGARDLLLIGYSGGGALAALLARRDPNVSALVTLAGNLDIDAWARLHGYSRLSGSLNPAAQPPLPAGVAQWHFVGTDDDIVPPALVDAAIDRGPGVHVEILPGVGHGCGWETHWPGLLEKIAR